MDPQLARDVAAAYAAGGTQRQVAAQFGIYPRLVREALRQQGVASRPIGARWQDPDELAAWVDRYRAGETVESIAQGSGLTRSPVARRLRRAGVEIDWRSRSHFLRWDADRIERVVERYMAGERLQDIAAGYGVSANRLRFVLAKSGHPANELLKARRQAGRVCGERLTP